MSVMVAPSHNLQSYRQPVRRESTGEGYCRCSVIASSLAMSGIPPAANGSEQCFPREDS
jgi:hypothetical protein